MARDDALIITHGMQSCLTYTGCSGQHADDPITHVNPISI